MAPSQRSRVASPPSWLLEGGSSPDQIVNDPQLREAFFGPSAVRSKSAIHLRQRAEEARFRGGIPVNVTLQWRGGSVKDVLELPADDLCPHHYVYQGANIRDTLQFHVKQKLLHPSTVPEPYELLLARLRRFDDLFHEQVRARFSGQEDFGPIMARLMVPMANKDAFEQSVFSMMPTIALHHGERGLLKLEVKLLELRDVFHGLDVNGKLAIEIEEWYRAQEAWRETLHAKGIDLLAGLMRGVADWNVGRPPKLDDCRGCEHDRVEEAKYMASLGGSGLDEMW